MFSGRGPHIHLPGSQVDALPSLPGLYKYCIDSAGPGVIPETDSTAESVWIGG